MIPQFNISELKRPHSSELRKKRLQSGNSESQQRSFQLHFGSGFSLIIDSNTKTVRSTSFLGFQIHVDVILKVWIRNVTKVLALFK